MASTGAMFKRKAAKVTPKVSRKNQKAMPSVTTNPDDIVDDDDDDDEEEEDFRLVGGGKTLTEQGYAQKKKRTSYNSFPARTIVVKKEMESNMSSSIQGPSQFIAEPPPPPTRKLMDMSMTELNDEMVKTYIKSCVKVHVFRIWKFYQRDFQASFSTEEGTICGFILKKTGIPGDEDWWLSQKKDIIKTLTDCRNNAIKNMQTKFKGKDGLEHNHFVAMHLNLAYIMHPEGVDKITGAPRHSIFDGGSSEVEFLLMMRQNVCHYATIIDTYAPCIVGYSKWNNDVNMNRYCATTDWKMWGEKVLSISDEAFIVVCLICYARKWHTEFIVKPEKQVRKF